MKYCEIEYTYEGKEYSTVERENDGWEETYTQRVLNKIECITNAGAKITKVIQYRANEIGIEQ